jgi:hypothetical protein
MCISGQICLKNMKREALSLDSMRCAIFDPDALEEGSKRAYMTEINEYLAVLR